MKKFSAVLLIAVICLAIIPACKKSKGGGGGTPETPLVVETTPAATGQVEAPAPGPDFPLKVEVKSTMPSSGVKIEITARKDGSADPAFFTTTRNTSNKIENFIITGTPKTVICVVNIKVTSITSATNVWTGTYKYSSK
ncbi:MAG: hypothetical protein H7Y27_08495 [Gemmatimonadaceae bacterium]|nr:hypothetical protein [Chitinophagaceae bacterium]